MHHYYENILVNSICKQNDITLLLLYVSSRRYYVLLTPVPALQKMPYTVNGERSLNGERIFLHHADQAIDHESKKR